MQKQWAPFLQNSTPSRCCQTAFESLSWFTAHCWNIHMVDHESVFWGDGSHFKRPILERCSYHVSISFVQRCSFRSQQNAGSAPKTRSLQRFGRFGISAGGYSPQTKGVIEFGGWSRESQALFVLFLKKKTMLQRTPPFLSKIFWLHPLTTFLLLLCSTASNAAAALASILRQQALEVSVPTGEMRMHKNPFNHREVRMECMQILSKKHLGKTNMEPDTVLLVCKPSIFDLLWLQGPIYCSRFEGAELPKRYQAYIHHFSKVEMSKCSSLCILYIYI